MRFKMLLSALMMLLLIASSAAAQEITLDDQPFMQMLARVPQNAPTNYLFFNDRTAITQAYPEAQMPADWAAFNALDSDNLTDESRPLEIWWRVFFRFSSSSMAQNLMLAEMLPESLGIDFFQVQQELSFGQPPENTLYLAGTWDADSIRAALATRDYTLNDENDVAQLWCEEDCLTGPITQIDARDPSNPFGGDLGQNWPMLLTDDTLMGNRSEPLMRAFLSAANDEVATLAQNSLWRAAVSAATQQGILLQAAVFNGDDLSFFSNPLSGVSPMLSPEELQSLAQERLEGYVNLPPFQLMLLADTVSQGEQVAKVVVVYQNEADARAAADALPGRIAAYVSLATPQPLSELLSERNINQPTVEVQPAEGVYTVVIDFSAPQPEVETLLSLEIGDPLPEGYAAPGIPFALLTQAMIRQDIGWLSTAPREVLEALAEG
jgi:hypothetical protein